MLLIKLFQMKTVIRIITKVTHGLLIISFLGYSQSNINIIQEEVFMNVKFKDVYLTDIINTNGNVEQITSLFSYTSPSNIEIESYGEDIGMQERVFNFENGMMIAFTWEIIGQDPEVVRLESNSITINGTTLNLGDSIDLLSNNYLLRTSGNGLNSMVIEKDGAPCCPIAIRLNSFNRIYKITYYVVP